VNHHHHHTYTHTHYRRYKHLIDVMPIYVVPVLLFIFAAAVAGGVVLGALAGPGVFTSQQTVITDPREIGQFFVCVVVVVVVLCVRVLTLIV
jgi:hypothetical protein